MVVGVEVLESFWWEGWRRYKVWKILLSWQVRVKEKGTLATIEIPQAAMTVASGPGRN